VFRFLPSLAEALLATGLILAALLAVSVLPRVAHAEVLDPYSKFYELYVRTVRLASQGIDVGEVVGYLSKSLELLEAGRYGEAFEEMVRAEDVVARLELSAGGVVMRGMLVKYGATAVLALLPVAIYLLLPRVYVYAWYRARRRWVVVREHTRR
jgi:hypothetical protein